MENDKPKTKWDFSLTWFIEKKSTVVLAITTIDNDITQGQWKYRCSFDFLNLDV